MKGGVDIRTVQQQLRCQNHGDLHARAQAGRVRSKKPLSGLLSNL
jgi:hypothetical protein